MSYNQMKISELLRVANISTSPLIKDLAWRLKQEQWKIEQVRELVNQLSKLMEDDK